MCVVICVRSFVFIVTICCYLISFSRQKKETLIAFIVTEYYNMGNCCSAPQPPSSTVGTAQRARVCLTIEKGPGVPLGIAVIKNDIGKVTLESVEDDGVAAGFGLTDYIGWTIKELKEVKDLDKFTQMDTVVLTFEPARKERCLDVSRGSGSMKASPVSQSKKSDKLDDNKSSASDTFFTGSEPLLVVTAADRPLDCDAIPKNIFIESLTADYSPSGEYFLVVDEDNSSGQEIIYKTNVQPEQTIRSIFKENQCYWMLESGSFKLETHTASQNPLQSWGPTISATRTPPIHATVRAVLYSSVDSSQMLEVAKLIKTYLVSPNPFTKPSGKTPLGPVFNIQVKYSDTTEVLNVLRSSILIASCNILSGAGTKQKVQNLIATYKKAKSSETTLQHELLLLYYNRWWSCRKLKSKEEDEKEEKVEEKPKNKDFEHTKKDLQLAMFASRGILDKVIKRYFNTWSRFTAIKKIPDLPAVPSPAQISSVPLLNENADSSDEENIISYSRSNSIQHQQPIPLHYNNKEIVQVNITGRVWPLCTFPLPFSHFASLHSGIIRDRLGFMPPTTPNKDLLESLTADKRSHIVIDAVEKIHLKSEGRGRLSSYMMLEPILEVILSVVNPNLPDYLWVKTEVTSPLCTAYGRLDFVLKLKDGTPVLPIFHYKGSDFSSSLDVLWAQLSIVNQQSRRIHSSSSALTSYGISTTGINWCFASLDDASEKITREFIWPTDANDIVAALITIFNSEWIHWFQN